MGSLDLNLGSKNVAFGGFSEFSLKSFIGFTSFFAAVSYFYYYYFS